MIHAVQAGAPSTRSTVHGIRDTEETWCNYAYMSEDTFMGNRISRLQNSNKPISCKRCIFQLRKVSGLIINRMPPAQLERFVEDNL